MGSAEAAACGLAAGGNPRAAFEMTRVARGPDRGPYFATMTPADSGAEAWRNADHYWHARAEIASARSDYGPFGAAIAFLVMSGGSIGGWPAVKFFSPWEQWNKSTLSEIRLGTQGALDEIQYPSPEQQRGL